MRVLGIGNALVDIMTIITDDDFLLKYNLPKGSMQLVDKDLSDRIIEGSAHFESKLASGGSSANTIHGLARLGVQTGFIGKTGDDKFGKFFTNDLVESNITPHLIHSTELTGRAIALVSPDGERTFATYLGAAAEMTSAELNIQIFKSYDIIHIEGYLLQNYDLIEAVVRYAKAAGLKLSLDLASYNVVESNKEFLNKIIPGQIDIIFANEEEAYAFTGLEPSNAIKAFSEIVPLSIVKLGAKGAVICNRKETVYHNAQTANCIDTTGAGDLYAAGFLYGYINQLPLFKCGEIGSYLGGHVVEVIGPKIHSEIWEKIKLKIDKLV